MRLRGAILFLGIALLLPVASASAQHPGQGELPSAPSTAQQNSHPLKATLPAQGQTALAPQESTPPAQAVADPVKADAAALVQPPAADVRQSDVQQNDVPPKAGAASSSGSPAPALPEGESIATIRKTVNEVNVVFIVTDKHGRYVKDLKKDDFKVIDDSKPAEEIRSFHSEADLPLQVGLLVDASNSVRDRFKFEQEAAVEFLNQTIRRKYDKAFVVGFDVTPEVTQDFTDDTQALSIGVRALRPGGGTAMYDALYFACRDKLTKAPQSGPVRRAIILLSDGEDNQSHVTREEAIEMAQRAEVIVYTISTNMSGSGHHGDKILERIAEATGGRAYVPFQITEVANAFAAIQEELRSQYAISYKPADFRADGRYRTIEILAQNQKGLRIRSRHGYYAPSQ